MPDESAKTKKMLERLMLAAEVSSDSALAGQLGVSAQAIYDAKKRAKVPDAWIRIIAEKCPVSADWLLFGRGAMRPWESGSTERDAALLPKAAEAAGGAPAGEFTKQMAGVYERLCQALERELDMQKEIGELKAKNAELEGRLGRCASGSAQLKP